MKKRDIIPHIGLDNLHFGMSRSEIRGLLGTEFTEFRKTEFSENTTDSYEGEGIHCYYDRDNKLNLLETFLPCSAELGGISLISRSVSDVIEELGLLGHNAIERRGSYRFESIGVAVYAPSTIIEGVSVFPRGYYDT
jgi:hypothetical protein